MATRAHTPQSLDTPRQTIAAIADELERLAGGFERARDPRCVFARAYARLTRVLAAAVPDAGFADPQWITELALVFAEYYLRALREHDAGTLAKGAWATVFAASERGRTSVLEELVLGMTAHIVNDLPLALCDVGLTAPNGQSRVFDYHLLNDVLGGAIEEVQAEVSRRYDPVLHVLDHLFEDYDEILTNYGLRISRAAAWYNAHRLLDPRSRADASQAIARSPQITLDEVMNPPLCSLRYLFRGARLISRTARRWPSDSTANPAPVKSASNGHQPVVPHAP
jgi:hypothetical protein